MSQVLDFYSVARGDNAPRAKDCAKTEYAFDEFWCDVESTGRQDDVPVDSANTPRRVFEEIGAVLLAVLALILVINLLLPAS